MSDIVTQLETVQDKVEHLLEKHERCRDSDKLLYMVYLRTYTNIGSLMNASFDDFAKAIMDKSVPVPESVRRVRQKIQEEGRWLGTRRLEKLEAAERVSDWAVGRDAHAH